MLPPHEDRAIYMHIFPMTSFESGEDEVICTTHGHPFPRLTFDSLFYAKIHMTPTPTQTGVVPIKLLYYNSLKYSKARKRAEALDILLATHVHSTNTIYLRVYLHIFR